MRPTGLANGDRFTMLSAAFKTLADIYLRVLTRPLMNRRTFVQALGAAAAGVVALPGRALAAKRLKRVGLELYSVRKAMRADPDRTMAAVRAIGYTDVELLWSFNNFGRTPEQVRAI